MIYIHPYDILTNYLQVAGLVGIAAALVIGPSVVGAGDSDTLPMYSSHGCKMLHGLDPILPLKVSTSS